jgi:glycosyltransferase involved in cell wall biosynthesis
MKLSIIIPAYNAENYLPQLLTCLDKQMIPGVEVIIIDDGSKVPFTTNYSWATVIRQENAGPGIARNTGLDKMTGEYFTFIDADDMVADNYLQAIFDKIETEAFDYCYLSWKSMPGGWQCSVQLKSVEDKFPGFNLCVWNRVYKTATFGKHRFNPKKLWSEDADFIYRLNEHGKKSFISEYLYFYRSDTPNSWTKRMMSGDLDYCRIVYNLREVKADNTDLLDEIKREYADNEIVLLTDRNEIPELANYCMMMKYNTPVSGTILRGDLYNGFRQIQRPYVTQVLIYVAAEHAIGGIETWTYNFCVHMHKYYDITVLYDAMFDTRQMDRLLKMVPVIKNDTSRRIVCDTAINCRIVKPLPSNIRARQTVQMCHTCYLELWNQTKVPKLADITVFVSETAAQSFTNKPDEYVVIHNLTCPKEAHKPLNLISATRSTPEKGLQRMLKLANLLTAAGIKYVWLYFGKNAINGAPRNLIQMPPDLDIADYMTWADYLVQLSDSEAFGYSIVEALELGTAVITTPLDVLPELGIHEGEHGYTVPFEVDGFDVQKLLDIPQFEYRRDNAKPVKQWRKLLGNTKPKHTYKPDERVSVRIIRSYKDIQLDRVLAVGEIITVQKMRAEAIQQAGFGEVINDET